ncbi:MAG: SAM-dependent methyltransferase [Glaciihabitans sp.]|nr:SAM-dependent methyltransferase [Glaciihabitans sp.]
METSELMELLSAEGLRLLDSLPRYDSTDDVVKSVATLRKAGHSPALVAAVLSQSKLRARAQAKFGPFADRMLFTEAGLEQATRLQVAAHHAGRFQAAGVAWVADLGCGIGADALAIAALDIEVTGVERDQVTAALASFNLAPWSNARIEQADVTEYDLSGVDGIYLDPARRNASRRLSNPADWSPSLDFAFGLAKRFPTGIKLGPGIDRDLIPAEAEAQWISVGREVVEVGLWFGSVARPGIGRAALLIGEKGAVELTAVGDSEDAEIGSLGEFIYEPDGAVIRARLIGDLVRNVNGRMLHPSIAYFSTDERTSTPFATRFRVLETFPFDERLLKKELASRRIGTLEIKKRGMDVDPARLRTKLSLKGDAAATLILTRVGDKRVALLAERDAE